MIYTPKIYGTCNGAKRAIDMAYSLVDKKVVIYKDILHNSRVIDDLKKVGIECVESLDNIESDCSVIIRAHGEGKDTYDFLESKNINVYDATCPNVVRIHDIIKDRYNKGYRIIIIGKKNHPEVVGSNGWCDNLAMLVENSDDVLNIGSLSGKVLIICQTTISTEMFEKLSQEIISKYDCDYEVINTVCLAQKAIQNSSVELAKKMDYVFVIGGESSSNTKELYNICNKYCKSYMFSSLTEFFSFIKKEKDLTINNDICITGGASTPIYLIEEYKNLLQFYLFYKDKLNLFETSISKMNESFISDGENSYVLSAIEKLISLNSGGKYVRAFLINLGYELFGKRKNYALDLSLAYELFQTSILIHDDIIDNASFRRGKKTVPVLYKEEFESIDNYDDSYSLVKNDISNSLALCVGDLGYYFVNKIMLDKYSRNKNFISVMKYYNNIVINTIKGEIIDVILPFLEHITPNTVVIDDIFKIFEMKTSWYTIIGPFGLGMTLAGAPKEEIEKFENILMPLGIAFQIKDDLLGIYSDSSILGKDSTDISEFKQTLLYFYTVNQDEYKDELLKYYGKNNLSNSDIEKVRELFEKSGAKKFAVDMMNEMFDKVKKDISSLEISDKYKSILLGFVLYLELRDK